MALYHAGRLRPHPLLAHSALKTGTRLAVRGLTRMSAVSLSNSSALDSPCPKACSRIWSPVTGLACTK